MRLIKAFRDVTQDVREDDGTFILQWKDVTAGHESIGPK